MPFAILENRVRHLQEIRSEFLEESSDSQSCDKHDVSELALRAVSKSIIYLLCTHCMYSTYLPVQVGERRTIHSVMVQFQ